METSDRYVCDVAYPLGESKSFTLGRSAMTRRRTTAAAALLAALTLGFSACGEDSDPDPDPSTSPTASTSSPAPSTTSTAPTPSATGGAPAGWEDKYTHDELQAYQVALRRWQRYQQLAEPIDKAGKYTPEAEKVFKEYVATWQTSVLQLKDTERAGIRIEVPPAALWSIADSIKISKGIDGALMTIRQCTDYSKIRVTKNGEDISARVKPEHVYTPLLIEMTNLGGKWKQLKTTVGKKPCAA